MPHTQEELERSIVSDFRETFGAYFSPGCLYDVRFLQVETSEDGTIWFDMGLYIEIKNGPLLFKQTVFIKFIGIEHVFFIEESIQFGDSILMEQRMDNDAVPLVAYI